MADSLCILIVEDSPTDAKLITHTLRDLGRPCTCERVEDEPALRAALLKHRCDVVLCDWSMPKLSGPRALAVTKEIDPEIPFIIVSGSLGEDAAVEAMRAGARDFVAKDQLSRLPPAIERELRGREARAERRRAEARFSRLAESGLIAYAIYELDGKVVDVNQAFLDMFGFTREEALEDGGWNASKPVSWDGSDDEALEQLRTTGVSQLREKELILKDGRRKHALIGVSMLDERQLIAFLIDLTQRKEAERALAASEEQLRHAQKMEAIGRLAGGVAHDFNNLLSVILTYAELMQSDLDPNDPHHADAKEIVSSAKRAADLTRQLLLFSRQQVIAPRVVDLNATLEGIDKMLRRLLGEDIDLAIRRGADLGRVKADPGGIDQILMNLAVNARDAMPTGGKLTIETQNVELDDAFAKSHRGVKPGPYVMLAMTDTGVGMDKQTLGRIFEPFFTTKEKGKGTGLGLSTVFGIVQQSGGTIWVYSEVGVGTTFKLYFPRVDELPEAEQPAQPLPGSRGGETILLVEDEDGVRAAALNILHRHGYTVIEARNAGEALLLFENRKRPIDLLLTDVVMPQMSGPALAMRLSALQPGLRVLCMSGYTDDSIVRHGILDARIAYLQKPITPSSLAYKVRAVLDAPPIPLK